MKKQVTLCLAILGIFCNSSTAQLPSYLPADGLVGWWPFNGNANDESGNGNDGVVNGATLTEDRFGNADKAYHFQNSFIVCQSPSFTFSETSTYSATTWVRFDQFPDQGEIIFSGTLAANNFVWLIDTQGPILRYGTAKQQNDTWYVAQYPVSALSLDVWYNLTITYMNGNQKLYLNGNLIGAAQYSNSNSISTILPLCFGAVYDNSNNTFAYFSGDIDDIAVYNRALTEQEIQNLYTGSNETGDTGDGPTPLPQGIPYQAAARDAQGQVIANAPVNVRFSLHEGAVDGAVSYSETHVLTTNSMGLFNTVFGNGAPEQSAFDGINWAATTKFLQVEIDLGDGYVDMGTTQLLSVPYAFRSDEAARIKNAGLPIFANNAAALAGGLAAGEMYRTAAGALMVVFE